jgi:hypothetical protein
MEKILIDQYTDSADGRMDRLRLRLPHRIHRYKRFRLYVYNISGSSRIWCKVFDKHLSQNLISEDIYAKDI